MDQAGFRKALGRFATGVTIVTTRDRDGKPFGVTANSFNSVSLDPPMVLWSLARSSQSMAVFETAERFAVHVLGENQRELSNRFASRGTDKFAGLAVNSDDVPLLEPFAARFVCRTAYRYEGGDHIIFVGEVIDFHESDTPPLLYHAGGYAEARSRPGGPIESIAPEEARIGGDSLVYLLAQASTQVKRVVDGYLRSHGLEEHRFLLMSIVAQSSAPAQADVRERLATTGFEAKDGDFDELRERGWLGEDKGQLALTAAGRQRYVELLARLKAFEDQIMTDFTPGELADVRVFLRRLVQTTAEGVPPLLG